jgi:hypothetical protein
VGTGSGDDQAVSRVTVKRRRERIEGEHHLDAEWHRRPAAVLAARLGD